MTKRILIFSLGYYPKHIGGAEVAIKEITDRIDPSEFEFHMIANRYDSTLPKVERIGNVLVHRIGIATKNPSMADLRAFPLHLNKMLFQFLAYWKALELHRKHHYDGIWAMMAHACGIPAGMFKGRHPEVPYLLTLQEGDPPEKIEGMMRKVWPLFKAGFTRAEYLQSISVFLSSWGKRMGFTGTSLVIPNGVDVDHFIAPVSAEQLAHVRQEIGKKEGECWLITTSRLVHKNALDDVIRALPELPDTVHFLILGTGPDEPMLKTLARDLDVSERVHFYGFVDHSVIPAFYKACDIFIRPSRSEGMGNSFVEAMAAGIPVIATQEGGISDFLYDAKRNPGNPPTGWAVQKDSPEDIVTAVKSILADPALCSQTVQNAKELAVRNYGWVKIATDMREKIFKPLYG